MKVKLQRDPSLQYGGILREQTTRKISRLFISLYFLFLLACTLRIYADKNNIVELMASRIYCVLIFLFRKLSIFSISRKKKLQNLRWISIVFISKRRFLIRLKKDLEKKTNFYRTKRKVPKVIYCLRYCFLLTKNCMHNEVWGYMEILPNRGLNMCFTLANQIHVIWRDDNNNFIVSHTCVCFAQQFHNTRNINNFQTYILQE